jgi:uncharacterized membrane protein (UPF0127 family)
MKKIFILYGALVVIVLALIIWRVSASNFSLPFISQSQAQINGQELRLMVVKDEKSRMKGLSGRRSLNENTGMLFVFDKKDTYGFWMKNMKFPIDIIYLDGNKVVDIKKNVPEPKSENADLPIYTPDQPANHVLEVNAGVADKLKITEGSTITFENID